MYFLNLFFVVFIIFEIPIVSVFGHSRYSVTFPTSNLNISKFINYNVMINSIKIF